MKTFRRAVRGLGIGMGIAGAVSACSGFGGSGEAGGAGSDPSGGSAPPQAPPLRGKPVDSELTETFGVFVTSTGAAAGDGTRIKPFGTIAAGIAAADARKLRVYVCVGVYREAIALKSGVSLVGGLVCEDPSVWKAAPGQRSRIEAPTSPAVLAKDVTQPTRFDGFDVVAPKGTATSPSSIALLANGSGALVVATASLTAGDGANGADGADPTPLTPSNLDGQPGGADVFFQPPAGAPAKPNRGGAGGAGSCGGTASQNGTAGSAGGDGGSWFCSGPDPVGNYYWTLNQSVAGAPYTPKTAAPVSSAGVAGAAGVDGASARSTGTFGPDGFVPADGTPGSDGAPGHGGKGGDAKTEPSPDGMCQTRLGMKDFYSGYEQDGASGGGGGAGGCPGLAGSAGKGGGASVAALLVASGGLTFDGALLASGRGGAGGRGSLGSDATPGGAVPSAQTNAYPAQAGGAGGRAGVSGSGAGAPSYGIAHTTGAPPTILPTTKITSGIAGGGVATFTKRDVGGIRTLPGSPDGDAKDVYAF